MFFSNGQRFSAEFSNQLFNAIYNHLLSWSAFFETLRLLSPSKLLGVRQALVLINVFLRFLELQNNGFIILLDSQAEG